MIYLLILLLLIIAVTLVVYMRSKTRSFSKLYDVQGQRTDGYVMEEVSMHEDNASTEEEPTYAPVCQGTLPYSVMVVDDQSSIRLLLCELFELEGVTVYEAQHGRMAIEQMKRHDIDFILLDLKMPDMDGIDALKEIRQFNSTVMVAMITAYGDPDKLEMAKQLGTLAFFAKPFDIDKVKTFVMSKLEHNRLEKEGGVVS